MALDATKWRVNVDKTIEYTGPNHTSAGVNYVTVLELHRWLQNLADDASSSNDDYMDITRDTPTEKAYDTIITLKNGYTLFNDTTAQYIYGGSIIQGSGGTEVIWDGLQVLAPAGMHLILVQDGAVISSDFWNSIPNGDTLKGINREVENGISHQFMVKVRTAGADIDGRRLIGLTRDWGKTYGEFKVNGTARGVNVMAFTGWADDLNNQSGTGTIAGYTDITNTTTGYVGLSVNGSTTQYFYSQWNAKGSGSRSIKDFYERMKYLTRQGEATTLYGIPGQMFRGITHEITVDTKAGANFSPPEKLTWGSGATAGEGQMLATNSVSVPTKVWIQLLKGVLPTDNMVMTAASGGTCQVNVTVTERPISAPFVGICTGSAIIGGYGVGIEVLDLTSSDKLFDLSNAVAQPPNLVTFTVGGLVENEDYVLVGPANSGALHVNQLTLNGALTGAAVTSVVVNQTIPADTPTTGSIRIQRQSGKYTKHTYTSRAGSTFTIASSDFSGDNAANAANTFISYIDKLAGAGETSLAFQTNFDSARSLFVRVRDGGSSPIKTFESTATLGSGGGSVTAIRTSDA